MPQPVYCTKIASRLTRTYTDRHGLKDLVREVLNIDLSKQQQSSDWGAADLSEAQLAYAASDVLHLHGLARAARYACWRARDAPNLQKPASNSSRPEPGSISTAGRPRTSLRIRKRLEDVGSAAKGISAPFRSHW